MIKRMFCLLCTLLFLVPCVCAGAEDSGKGRDETQQGSAGGWLGLHLEIGANLMPGLPWWLRR